MTAGLSFEVLMVKHEAHIIFFTWNDIGGTYNVYRDGTLLYEGTVPEFGDGDFKHAKLYNYKIERVVNDMVVDVIALQTSAFAEEHNVENPLQSLVMTTIVAEKQIALSWEEIDDVNEYDIYRNGVFMEKVQVNRYIDRDFSLEESYIYGVYSKRPLAKSKEAMSKSKSAMASILGKLKVDGTAAEAEIEEFSIHKLVESPKKLLTSTLQQEAFGDVNRWRFRYTTFLKDGLIKNPNRLSRNHFFKGDSRGFDAEGEGFRTRVDIDLAYDEKDAPLTFTKEVGATIAYNYMKQVREQATASKEGITLARLDHSRREAGFLLTHAVGNPLMVSPVIDYEVKAVLRRDGTVDITGYHDQAPHHEIYVVRGIASQWMPVHLAESKGLEWMSGITGWHYWRFSNFE